MQVAKDPIGTKGARVTTHITLPGRYLVFMPTVDHVGISRRIDGTGAQAAARLSSRAHRPEGRGLHRPHRVRGTDRGARSSRTSSTCVDLGARSRRARRHEARPALLHTDHGLVLRIVRDHFTGGVERHGRRLEGALRGGAARSCRTSCPSSRSGSSSTAGRSRSSTRTASRRRSTGASGKKVWLKSGGYLIIDQTEALTAIDVNSGKFVGQASLEETTFQDQPRGRRRRSSTSSGCGTSAASSSSTSSTWRRPRTATRSSRRSRRS